MKRHSILRTGQPLRLTEQQYRRRESENIGICRACGADRPNTEGDAERYPCDECKAPQVYGVESLLEREEIYILG